MLLDGRKVAGILAEGRPQEGWAVLGIGLNVAVRLEELPPELRATAGDARARRRRLEPMLALLLARSSARWRSTTSALLDAWRARDALRGREVAWAGGRGTAAGVDGDGRLVVDLAGGGRTALTRARCTWSADRAALRIRPHRGKGGGQHFALVSEYACLRWTKGASFATPCGAPRASNVGLTPVQTGGKTDVRPRRPPAERVA